MHPYRSTMMVLWLCVHLLDWFRRLFFLSFNIWHSIDACIVWGCDCFSDGLDGWIKNADILTLAYTAWLHCVVIKPSIRLSMQLFKPADENYDIKFWPFRCTLRLFARRVSIWCVAYMQQLQCDRLQAHLCCTSHAMHFIHQRFF